MTPTDAAHVLVWVPLYLHPLAERDIAAEGWELQPRANFDARMRQPFLPGTDLPRDADPAELVAWTTKHLGYPVTLTPDVRKIRAARFRRWHTEPIYYVRGRKAIPVAEAAAVLPALDAPCGECTGYGTVTSPEWHEWNARARAAQLQWAAAHPGGNWYASAEGRDVEAEQPDPVEVMCLDCDGSGRQVTAAGRQLLAFLQAHHPAHARPAR